MRLLKLSALSSLILFFVSSCERNFEKGPSSEYVKTEIAMTGAQETPANVSAATGSLNVFYSKKSKLLQYTFRWSGLADTIVGIHIHGLAPTGYAASIVQNILTTRNEAVFPFRGGSYTGTLLVDGARIKEEDLLNHLYYVNIHTKTYPGGEIRGQIRFQ
ncbi:MAG: CHRD domain-containing protein [Chitinophagaceae bacterium]|nr:CHRD domain-containing protein [Chitinophagaceae bacterium]